MNDKRILFDAKDIPAPEKRVLDWSVADRITPRDFWLCHAIAKRTGEVVRDLKARFHRYDLVDPDVQQLWMDVVFTHIARPLMLEALLSTNIFDFMDEVTTITRNINRVDKTFPDFVPLRYAVKT